jgi:hypothetical protein
MSYTSYAALESLVNERVADRLTEAAQQRLIDAVKGSHAVRRPRSVVRLLSYVASLV